MAVTIDASPGIGDLTKNLKSAAQNPMRSTGGLVPRNAMFGLRVEGIVLNLSNHLGEWMEEGRVIEGDSDEDCIRSDE